MYRDPGQTSRERYDAAIERGERQLAGLEPEELAELPEALRQKLSALESEVVPEGLAPAAILNAERALDEREPLLEEARKFVRALRRAKRRRQRDLALLRGVGQRRRRRLGVFLLLAAVVLTPAYFAARSFVESGCHESAVCRVRGECVSDVRLSCVAGSDADCKKSDDCRDYGFCNLVGTRCEARYQEDCARLAHCQPPGSCAVQGGVCMGVDR